MLSYRRVRETINWASERFSICWNTLSDLRNKTVKGDSIWKFQETLAEALMQLEEMKQSVYAEERRLIKRKYRLSDEWFRQRMRTLARYRDSLTAATAIGRGIGDAFAWIFYIRHREYLHYHLEHQPINNMPLGIGGKGELEFLRKIRRVGNAIAIYHGTTTFLRIGDVSLFEIGSGRFLGLGELKTKSVGPDELEIVVHIISREISRILPPGPAAQPFKDDAPANMRARRDRQLAEMTRSLRISVPNKRIDLAHSSHMSEFQVLASALKKRKSAYQRVGDGLLLIGIRGRRNRDLGSTLLGPSTEFVTGLPEDAARRVAEILLPDSSENRIVVGGLDLTLVSGATPLFWWDIDREMLRTIYFGKTQIVTVYNPAFLAQKLRAAGLQAEVSNNSAELRVSRQVGDHFAILHGFEYFSRLISNHLMCEDAVVELLTRTMQEFVDRGTSSGNRVLNINVQLHWL